MRFAAFILLLTTATLGAKSIVIADASAYVHGNGQLVAQYGQASPTFFSTLDANNLGTLGWSFTNTSGSALTNVGLFGFLDADIDRADNTFFNEYGEFIGLSLPAAAPAGAIAATSWQIDEPGFLFGTIRNDLAAGLLRNANFVSSAYLDDVSLALRFLIGTLSPGQTATLTLQLSLVNIGGLRQFDPDSDSGFYLTGYATVSGSATPDTISPEPSSFMLIGFGLGAMVVCHKKSARPNKS